jgi:LPS-assembly lipoprotein
MRQLIASFVIGFSLLLAGCSNTRPLYGTGADGKSAALALAGIAVDEQKTRAGQIVRNNLISSFGGSGSDFVLRLTPVEKTQEVSSSSIQDLTRKRYRLSVKYELADVKTSQVLTSGSSFSNVSYDTVEQPIADLRAAENARERAAREVAEDIRLRLAAHFASGS